MSMRPRVRLHGGPHPPSTVVGLVRGEITDQPRQDGHCLIWLWPTPAAAAPDHPALHRERERLAVLRLAPGEGLTVQRDVVDEPTLEPQGDGWRLRAPSDAAWADVSRSPTRLVLGEDRRLRVQSEARGPQRFWLDLRPVDGPTGPVEVTPWTAVAVGPLVLWYVPEDLAVARRHATPVAANLRDALPGFHCNSLATAEVITHLRRRAQMKVLVPRTAADQRWEAGQPFVLAGEPGSGKTTLAKAVYRESGATGRFAAVHPSAVEQEIDLVAFTGCANFAHDGARVPDQPGHLDAVSVEDGVLLVDEVHTLHGNLEKHLIDLLTEWTWRPRGDDTRRRRVRGLLVFATNRLDQVRDQAQFPADLFARMGGEAGVIELPPLRRRRFELPHLAEAILGELTPPLPFAKDALRKLLLHHWPLNHWELSDVVREAHSLAVASGLPSIGPELLKVRSTPTTPVVEAPPPVTGAPAPTTDGDRAFPAIASWVDLFAALSRYPGFKPLRDAWQVELDASSAAVNRRIGRLIRCARCTPSSCPRCFLGALASQDPADLLHRLEQLAAGQGLGPQDTVDWILTALRELVVERVEQLRTEETRAALVNATVARDQATLLACLDTLRRHALS